MGDRDPGKGDLDGPTEHFDSGLDMGKGGGGGGQSGGGGVIITGGGVIICLYWLSKADADRI